MSEGMAIYLMCSTSGGLPIFTKRKGECDSLPFSTIASLNGVHMFCQSQNVELVSTQTIDDWLFKWENYNNLITIIIAIKKEINEDILKILLDYIYNSFILFTNLNDFLNEHKNFELMKRESKHYLPIIDNLLNSYDTDILEYNDCILSAENLQLLIKLNEFSNNIKSLFCSIIINQKLAVATEGWWDLHIIDRKLLISLLNSSSSSQIDIPIYLPKRDANTAYRFVSIPIYGTVTVCTICGAEPSYNQINQIAHQLWKNDIEILQKAERCIPRNFPDTLEIDSNILGILLINKYQKKYVISRNLQQSSTGRYSMSGSVLRSFYYQSIQKIEMKNSLSTTNEINRDQNEEINCNRNKEALNKINDFPIESYWCSEYHKCHSYLNDQGNLICILYNASVPSYTMRLLTFETLRSIINDRSICW